MDITEPILQENVHRFVVFPIEHHDAWDMYKKSLASFWTADEIDFSADINDWNNKLNDNERYFIKNILAFFAASDGIVNENLALNFYNEVQVPEIRQIYATQIMMEAIHSECVTGDTTILTKKGMVPISHLEGLPVEIWNGEQWSEVLVESKGEKDIHRVTLSNGLYVDCSPEHRWVLQNGREKSTIDLKRGDKLFQSWQYPVTYTTTLKPFKNAYQHAKKSIENTMVMPTRWFSLDRLTRYVKKRITSLCIEKPLYYVPHEFPVQTKIEWLRGLFDSRNCDIFIDENHMYSARLICYKQGNSQFLKSIQELCLSLDVLPSFKKLGESLTLLYFDTKSLFQLQKLGLKTIKLPPLAMSTFENYSYTVSNIVDMKKTEMTYCFHEPLKNRGVFNGILTGQCYSLMIDTYVKNAQEKKLLFKSIENNPIVKRKADWALKWLNNETKFAERLLAFCAIEGIFFSGSFCSIYWLKSRSLMPSLSLSNQFISRDEALHCETCIMVYKKLQNKLSETTVHAIFKEAYEIEAQFVTEALPVRLIGMNADLMKQYIQFITDFWLSKLGYSKLFNVTNPFDFMSYISLENKTNFFENRVSEYQKASNLGREEIFTEEDF
jgi:ribonucleotide reductase beta subunit family protein with ferritin-like domain